MQEGGRWEIRADHLPGRSSCGDNYLSVGGRASNARRRFPVARELFFDHSPPRLASRARELHRPSRLQTEYLVETCTVLVVKIFEEDYIHIVKIYIETLEEEPAWYEDHSNL